MSTIATTMQRITARMRRMSPVLVEWASILLILLAVVVCTFSQDLPIAKQSPSRISAASNKGCFQFKKGQSGPDACKKHTTLVCIHFDTQSGICDIPPSDAKPGGCLDW